MVLILDTGYSLFLFNKNKIKIISIANSITNITNSNAYTTTMGRYIPCINIYISIL